MSIKDLYIKSLFSEYSTLTITLDYIFDMYMKEYYKWMFFYNHHSLTYSLIIYESSNDDIINYFSIYNLSKNFSESDENEVNNLIEKQKRIYKISKLVDI